MQKETLVRWSIHLTIWIPALALVTGMFLDELRYGELAFGFSGPVLMTMLCLSLFGAKPFFTTMDRLLSILAVFVAMMSVINATKVSFDLFGSHLPAVPFIMGGSIVVSFLIKVPPHTTTQFSE